MSKTKKLCYFAMLTALYVVMSAFLKFYVGVGHIQVDLGYIAFAVALCEFGVSGAVVGILGCAIESTLFTSYGFSISWVVANAVIGIDCGLVFSKSAKLLVRAVAIILYTAIGMLMLKTVIECNLYSIPYAVKFPKSFAAFVADSIVMICGLVFYEILKKRRIA